MGMESVIYGVIVGPRWPHYAIAHGELDRDPEMESNAVRRRYLLIDRQNARKVRANLEAIAALPEEDVWPFLARDLFASSTPSVQTTYKKQSIHFGGTFKQIEYDWEEWLAKFETLLRGMYWEKVHLHLQSEWLGHSYSYTWEDADEVRATDPERDEPVSHWHFSGGPRTVQEFLVHQHEK